LLISIRRRGDVKQQQQQQKKRRRQLDLRGYKLAAIENLGVLRDACVIRRGSRAAPRRRLRAARSRGAREPLGGVQHACVTSSLL